jgi:DNA-binding MarR family transcriptional regulator
VIEKPPQLETTGTASDGAAHRWVALTTLVNVAARRLRASLVEQIAPHALGESEFALLWVCSQPSSDRLEAEGPTQTELAHALDLSPASVSGLVEHLRSVGLLEGRRSTVDRRRQLWHLTDRGQEVVAQLLSELDGWALSLDRTFGGEEQASLGRLLGDLLRAVTPAISVAAGELPSGSPDIRRGAAA